jgi:hypothetical protein
MVNQKNGERRFWILLNGDGKGVKIDHENDLNGYDETDKHEVFKNLEKLRRTDRLISEYCFIALVVTAASVSVGLFILRYRILKYPFIKKFSKDYDW